MSIYEATEHGLVAVEPEPKSNARAAAALMGATLLNSPQHGDDAWRPLRSAFYSIAKSDDWRRSNPARPVDLDVRIAAAREELANVDAAAAGAEGHAAELLAAARGALLGRIAVLERFPQDFAQAESDYRRACHAHQEAQRQLNRADPDEVAHLLVEIERAAAMKRKQLRVGEAVVAAVQACRGQVLPSLATAKASVEKVRQLDEERSREVDGRGDDVAALAGAIE